MSDDENNMGATSLWVAGTIGALKALVFVCDIITYPVYYILHRPREKITMSDRLKARPIGSDEHSITIRSLQQPGKVHVTLVREGIDTLQKFLHYVVKIYGDKHCLGTRDILSEDDEMQPTGRVFKKYTMGDYKWKSFRTVDEEAASFGRGLRILGQEPLMNVVIFAETRAEWMIAAHGCFKQNIPLVTLYATLGVDAIAHGINETEVSIVITTHNLLPSFKKILPLTPKVQILIYMEDQLKETDTSGFKDGVHIVSFSQVVKDGRSANIAEVPSKTEDAAIIMYTSGSTGTPKGVILSHRNMMGTMKAFSDAVDINDDDVFLGYLPLAHVFELLTECVCLVYGVRIGYSTPLTMMDSSSKIKKGSSGDATVLKPTLLTSVPLILDRIAKGVNDRVSKSSGLQRAIFRFAFEYRRSWARRGFETPLVNKLVFSKMRQILGGRIRLVLCGGAPLSQDTHEFIKVCLCVEMTPGYGLTETCAAATILDRLDMSTGRVGNPTTVSDVRLVDWQEGNYTVQDKPYPRGEVLVGGEHVSPGYYKLPDKTDEEFFQDDGRQWFKTGDIAELHPDGVLTIIDRKKDLVKLQLGEYVSLGKVEMELKTSALVENICVYGDSSKQYTVALVVPNAAPLAELAASVGITSLSFEQLCEHPEVERAVLRELQDHGRRSKLEKFEIPEAIKLCSEVWSPDMGLVTAAFKLRRKMIQDRYQHEINRMYAS